MIPRPYQTEALVPNAKLRGGGVMKKIEYVVGFLCSSGSVVLIRKQRPTWQLGRLNGVGGHIKSNETPLAAMQREFEEETGWKQKAWELAVIMTGRTWKVYFFFALGPVHHVKTKTDEEICLKSIDSLPRDVIPNLRWLIPLCLDQNVTKPVAIYDDIESMQC